MDKKIVIAGGTGFIGDYFTEQFTQQGYNVIIISRQEQNIHWDDKAGIINALEGSEMVINLAGKSVNCRYTKKNKTEILRSRTETTKAIGEAILECKNPPELWVNASSATIYRYSKDKPMTENDGETGSGFSVEVVKSWEAALFSFQLPGTRQIALRITIVLGKNGGVIKPYMNLVRFGLGGRQGNGNQMFSWVHIDDLFNIILFLRSHKNIVGPVNCASPHPVPNKELMRTLRKQMRVAIGLPSPAWLLKIGAVVIGTETELILKSRYVIPGKLLQAGFTFKFPDLSEALKNILNDKN